MTASTAQYLPFDASDNVWADIKPLYQQESDSPLCPIMYKPEYSSAMDLYRALVSSSPPELSARALALTEHLVKLNPSNYSVWQYRSQILLSFNEPQRLRDELDFLEALAHSNMKNYQVWQHRRLIVSALGDPSRELAFVAENLERDAKNYHTWAYRQWILAHFAGLDNVADKQKAGPGAGQFPHLWDGELAYTEQLLNEDVRNNSAWNHRWFCIFGRKARKPSSSDDDAVRAWEEDLKKAIRVEIGFTKAQIALAPNNNSAWNYLRGLHVSTPFPTPFSASLAFAQNLISTPVEAERDPTVDQFGRSPTPAIEWCLDSIEQALEAPDADSSRLLADADKLVTRLRTVDPIRKRFWAYRMASIRSKA